FCQFLSLLVYYAVHNLHPHSFPTRRSSDLKIVWFPKIYYQMDTGLLHILCEISLGKYQDQLLRLEDKLESGLYSLSSSLRSWSRSEEHTSELQSRFDLVCRLLLEKKK